MTEATLSGVKSLPPYIRGTDSLGKRFWGQGIALLPVLIAACLSGHTGVLRVLLLCLVSVVAFEYLAAKLFGKKENLRSGEALVAASRRGPAREGPWYAVYYLSQRVVSE